MIVEVDLLDEKKRSYLLTHTVMPRPIAWVSTVDESGRSNLAPFSYFTAVCNDPMMLLFCSEISLHSSGKKETIRNIESTGEFVINLIDEETAAGMNLTAARLSDTECGFEVAKVTPAASSTIAPPRVSESPVSFECELRDIITTSDRPGGAHIVLGKVKCIHVREDISCTERFVDPAKLRPVGKLGGSDYVRVTDTFQIQPGRLPRTIR